MKAQLERLAKRFNALAVRERAIGFASVLLVAMVLLYLLALEPSLAKKRRLAAQLAEAQKSVLTLQSLKTPTQDPLVARRAERDALRRQLAEIDKTMREIQRGLVPAERTARLLEEVLGSSRGLQLVSLRTMPVRRFDPSGGAGAEVNATANASSSQDAERQLYQHTFEMTLQGSYADLHDYLRRVEQLPWRLFWSRISVAVNEDQQSKLVVTLTVQTLSVSKAWLIV
jgi:MSHA biogenesis protein MshJ